MKRYRLRLTVEYWMDVDAENEEDAAHQGSDVDARDWDEEEWSEIQVEEHWDQDQDGTHLHPCKRCEKVERCDGNVNKLCEGYRIEADGIHPEITICQACLQEEICTAGQHEEIEQ